MATRNVDWAGLTNKVKGDAARSEIGRMRQLMDQIKGENAGVSSEVPAIDFDAYRGKIKSPGIVDAFESAYSKLSLPTFAASTADADAAFSALSAEAQTAVDESEARMISLDKEIEDMIANKLGPDTTVEDVYAQYPQVGDEIEQEIADMDWKKDI